MTARDRICEAVTMHDALRLYHHEGRRGRVDCPIHNGKDNNFSYKDEIFRCWVCGASGSVIDFVMQLFNIDFKAACVRLDHDFGLNITADKIEPHEAARIARERREKARQAENHKRQMNALCCEFRRLWFIVKEGPASPEYGYALNHIERIDYQIEELQRREVRS